MSERSYQELSDELETVIADLQAPEIKIDDALKLYKKGLKLVAALNRSLEQAEGKLKVLAMQREEKQ